MSGKVYFVGSGPGDPDYLTLKALKLLRSSDLVIYDGLVTKSVIRKIPNSVHRLAIRKDPHAKGIAMEEFTKLMVKNAMAGKTVVRLKSGDPLIFGRTWEEIDALENAGISYEIVPGVSSAFASAAISRTPLTDRRFSSSIAIVTGHEADAKSASSVDWTQLARSVDTLIVLMGASTISSYSEKLMEAGADGNAPVTVVYNASRENQKVIRTTLSGASGGIPLYLGDLCTVIINLRNLSEERYDGMIRLIPERPVP